MTEALYPLLFEPVYRDYLWGGGRIPARFQRPPRAGTSAESWEIADRPDGMSIVRNGPLRGASLRELVGRFGPALLGAAAAGNRFPLLIKIIDAGQNLSVQVHPDERGAARGGGEPKTEMWYTLDAAPGARVFAGFLPGTTRAAFAAALAEQRVETALRAIPLRRGDALYIPGGRVHAIGAGCLLLEVQQNSDTTFRLYDWGRLAADGRPRPLHLDQALQAIAWDDDAAALETPTALEQAGQNTVWRILRRPAFEVRRLDLAQPYEAAHEGRSFQALFVAAGVVEVAAGGRAERLPPGASCLLGAALSRYRLAPAGGPCQVLCASLP